MRFNDLYNNFKIVEQEVKRTASSSSSFQNMAFEMAVSIAKHEDKKVFLGNWECRGPRNQDNRNRNQDSSRRTVNVEEISSKAMLAIDGAGFDWSYMTDDEVPTNMALMAFSDSEVHNDKTCSKTCLKSFETLKTQLDDLRVEFNKSEFNLANYKRGLASVEEQLVFYKKNEVIFCEQLVVLKRDISYKDLEISMLKSELEKLKQEKESNQLKIENFDNASKSLDKLIGSEIPDKSRKEEFQQPEFEGYGPKTSKNVSEDTSNEVRESPDAPMVEKLVIYDKLERKTVFPTVAKIEFVRAKQQEKPVRKPVKYAEMYSFDHVQANCNYHQRERVVSGNNYTRVNYNYSTKKAHPSAHRNMAPRAVLMKTGLRPVNTVRPVNTAHPKTIVYSARPMSRFSKSAQSTVNRPYQIKTALTNKKFSQKVNTAKGSFYTARPKAVNTARPNLAVVNVVRKNQGHPQKEDQGYVDNGCSRHMTWNMSYLSDFKEFDEGYVLLKVPRKNNMYSVDMKNIIPKESLTCLVAKATLDESMLWHRRLRHAEAVNTACYVQNRVLVVKPHNKTPYELFRGRTPALSFMRPFGCHVTILNTLDYLGKFDGKSDEGFFVGYSLNSKAFRVYNIRTRKVEESLHIRFLEDKPIIAGDGPKWLFDIDVLTKSMNYVTVVAGTNSNDSVDGSLFDSSLKNASNDEPQPSSDAGKKDDEGVSQQTGIDDQERPENSTQYVNTDGPSINTASTNVNTGSLNINNVSPTITNAPLEAIHADFFGDETELDMSNITTTYLVPSTPNTRIHKDHSLDHVIGDVQSGVQTRIMTKTSNEQRFIIEPKKVLQALIDPSWIEAMQDKLLQNKKDERGIMIRNKARLVTQGYTQEEVYVCQPLGFEDPKFPDKVYKVEKALYSLHQAPRAWYETLSTYLLDNGFQRGQIDKTLFIKRVKGDILLVQVYVDDIIFGSTRNEMCTEFEKMMYKKFQMSFMGELTFFLGLQVTQKDDEIFISQDKYVDEILKKFGFSTVKTTSTPMETSKPLLKDAEAEYVDVYLYRLMIGSLMYRTASRPDIMFAICACARFQVTPKVSHLHAVKRIFRYLKGQPKLGLWYPKDTPFDLEAYTDSDYAGASLDRKSTTGGCQFLGSRLISWQCKKQTIVANSTTEAEYVAAASCCGQFWQTAAASTLDKGEMEITTTIDGKVKIVTEASIRRHLKLEDFDGISNLPTTKFFEQLALMGYVTILTN
ncbi:putative ribonuclease H-like domain-containing protein [Tanacetum coccineum]